MQTVQGSTTGVYSALKENYGCIMESKNDDLLRWIAYDNWTFTAVFGGKYSKLKLH